MLFESKVKRKQWINSVVLCVPDFIICSILAWYFSTGVWGALLFFIVLEVSLIILSWVRAIFLWLFNLYTFRKFLSSLFLDDLKNNHFPEPNNVESSTGEYLARVALEGKKPDAKFVAAYYIGYLECFRVTNQTMSYISMITAFEDAISEYKNKFKPRNDA